MHTLSLVGSSHSLCISKSVTSEIGLNRLNASHSCRHRRHQHHTAAIAATAAEAAVMYTHRATTILNNGLHSIDFAIAILNMI